MYDLKQTDAPIVRGGVHVQPTTGSWKANEGDVNQTFMKENRGGGELTYR